MGSLQRTTTRTADVSLLDGWCVVTRVHRAAVQSLDDARENLAATRAVSGPVRRPLLVDITVCAPLEPEIRHFYTGKLLDESFVAQALLVEASAFGCTMGNIYLRVARPGIPTRLFHDEPGALAWLRTFAS